MKLFYRTAKKSSKKILFLMLFAIATLPIYSQNAVWTDTFTNGVTPSTGQVTAWNNFRSSLTPGQYTYVTIKGTYDMVGKTCTDKTIVNAFATAVQNASAYTSPTSCGGNVWSICNRYGGEIWLNPPAQCSGSNCPTPNAYIIRVAIGNLNWGGINTSTCTNNPSQRMWLIFGKPTKPNDLSVSALPTYDVCAYTQALKATISNYGTNNIDSFRVYHSINGVIQTPLYITHHLVKSRDTVITLNPSFSFAPATTYTFKFWTSKPNGAVDSVASNDTMVTVVNFQGGANAPTVSNILQCGQGRGLLKATPDHPADSLVWYDAMVGGNMVAEGNNKLSPYLTATKTFYVQAVRLTAKKSLFTGYSGCTMLSYDDYTPNGTMFSITAGPAPVVLDSMWFIMLWNYNNTDYELRYKTGGYAGFEYNSGAWTMLSNGKMYVRDIGGLYKGTAMVPQLSIPAGQTFSFYFTTLGTGGGRQGNDIWADCANGTKTDGNITIAGGTYLYDMWANYGLYQGYFANVEAFYKTGCSGAGRVPYTITVKPTPTGAAIAKGSVFEGAYKAGAFSDPDIVAEGDELTYELVPPTGFNNSGHGSTWAVSLLEMKTSHGYNIPSGDTSVVIPSSSGPGKLSFIPSSIMTDSIIKITLKVMDLGPHFCDSVITRYIRVAPRGKPNFTFNTPVCQGADVFFENKSTVSTGLLSYKWYFGDGDSSDFVSPNHNYSISGLIPVRLVTTTVPYGYVTDTTILVTVSAIPSTDFTVTNKCEGLSLDFTNKTTIATGTVSYSWDFGDGTPTTSVTNPTHLYSTIGGYKVTLTASSNGCISVKTKNAYQFAKPTASFNLPSTPVCMGDEILFSNLSTISQGIIGAYWNFDDGNIETDLNAKHAYSQGGTYDIKLRVVSEFGCMDSVVNQLFVKDGPQVSFNYDRICSQTPTQFTNTTIVPTGQVPSYTWTFSDGGTSNAQNTQKLWTALGPQTVTLKAILSNGCQDEMTKDVVVLIQPKASFTISDICSDEPALFENKTTASQGGVVHSWDFGDGSNFSSETHPSHLYPSTTTYTYNVTLTSTIPGGCSDTAIRTITVSETPNCNFTIASEFQPGHRSFRFTPANTTYTNYFWKFGDGANSGSVNPLYQYTYNGSFVVTLIAQNSAGCECEMSQVISSNNLSLRTENGIALTVYPNPSNGEFILSTNAVRSSATVTVLNMVGAQVYSTVWSADSQELKIDLSGMAAGVYYLSVNIDGNVQNIKITIAR